MRALITRLVLVVLLLAVTSPALGQVSKRESCVPTISCRVVAFNVYGEITTLDVDPYAVTRVIPANMVID